MDMQDQILDFWFGRPGTADYGGERDAWFRKVAAFDMQIRERFGAAIETALAGGYADWTAPRAALARILLLDQFTRNVFRRTPQAFAGDTDLASVLAYAKSPIVTKAPIRSAEPTSDTVFWAQGFGAWGRFSGDGNAAGVRRDLAGFFSGVDTRVGGNGRVVARGDYRSYGPSLDDQSDE